MKLTRRGDIVLGMFSAIVFLVVMGLFGYVETLGYW